METVIYLFIGLIAIYLVILGVRTNRIMDEEIGEAIASQIAGPSPKLASISELSVEATHAGELAARFVKLQLDRVGPPMHAPFQPKRELKGKHVILA